MLHHPAKLLRKNRTYILGLLLVVSTLIFSTWLAAPTRELQSPHLESPREQQRTSVIEGTNHGGELSVSKKTQLDQNFGKLPMQFEMNQGQVAAEVKYISRGAGYTLFLKSAEALLSLKNPQARETEANSDQVKNSEVVQMRLVNSNKNSQARGLEELSGKVNYLIGNEPTKWRHNISTYRGVKFERVYPGIDLTYYGNQRQLEYDFVLSPQADPSLIRLRFDGTQRVTIDKTGSLLLKTTGGEEIIQHKPVVYQEVSGQRIPVEGNYVVHTSNEVGFEVGEYDKSNTLVIDPTLSYSTFFGGGVDDIARGIAVDASGNVYITGQTSSANLPVTAGGVQPSNSGGAGSYDAFVMKLTATGNAVFYTTYLGGQGFDRAEKIALDTNGRVNVTGYTQSTNFPTIVAYQPVKNVGADAFVAKLSADGSFLVFSTLLGGGGFDQGMGVISDTAGNVYVTGQTSSDNFPTLGNLPLVRGGGGDAFVAKFSATGALVYSSYLGGLGNDIGNGIALDSTNNVYITGNTDSTNFPTTPGAYRTVNAGNTDCFITKINAAGNALAYSTFLGGTGSDYGKDIKVDGLNNAYVTGPTSSTNFPIINPAAQSTHHLGLYDGFVTKLNAAGNQLVYSTFVGGSDSDTPNCLAIDGSGNAYVAGQTASTDFPTQKALQSLLAYSFDGFITKVNSTGSQFLYSTYLGGMGADEITGIAVGTSSVYVAGYTDLDFPTTAGGVFQVSHAPATSSSSNNDAIVAKILEGSDPTFFAIKGRLTQPDGVTPLAGVTISLTGDEDKTTTTNSDGYYIFELLDPSFSRTVTPDPAITTSPIKRDFASGLTGNVTNANFVATQSVLTISGRLTNVNRNPLPGLVVSLDGDATSTAVTNWNGVFTFQVTSGRHYTVSPPINGLISNWKFQNGPQQNSVDHPNLTQSVSNDDFTAATPQFTVAGIVVNTSGTPLVGLKVQLRIPGAAAPNTTDLPTNGTGNYTSVPLSVQGDYEFTPQPITIGGVNYNSFTPAQVKFFSNLTCNQALLPPDSYCSGNNFPNLGFEAKHLVSVQLNTNPSSLNLTVDGGAATAAPIFLSWDPGSSHTIATTSPQNGNPGTQFVFHDWSDNGAISHSVVASDATPNYQANFTTQHQLTVSAGAGGTVMAVNGFHNQGEVVQIDATPNPGFMFSGWTGTGSGSFTGATRQVSVTMNGPITEVASFAAAPPPNTIQFSAANFNGSEASTQLVVTINRTINSGPASVDYSTIDAAGANGCDVVNGKASSRCDYQITIGTVQFAAGESSKNVTIPLVDDAYVEGSENFTITLSNPTGATLGTPAAATLTITDNDATNGTSPIDGTSFFVRQHYLDFLNREPDSDGFTFWSTQITSCGADAACIEVKRINVSAANYLSIEFQGTGYLVERLYKAAYGDLIGSSTFLGPHQLPVPIVRFSEFLPDTQQIGNGVIVNQGNWEQQLENNKNAFVAAFAQRGRFTTAFPSSLTPAQFVDKLFQNAGVSPSTADRNTAINEFGGAADTSNLAARGRSLRDVAENATFNQQEFNHAFVLMQYFGYLRRNVNDAPDGDFTGYDFWLTKLQQFNGDYIAAEMVKAFLASIEYKERFGP